MANTHKGNIYEREAKEILEADGWLVEGQHRKAQYLPIGKRIDPTTGKPMRMLVMTGRDVFGSDLICKKAGEKTRWIQVGTRAMKMAKIRQIAPYPWNLNHDVVEVWARTEGKREFEIFRAPEFASVGIVAVPKKVAAQISPLI